MSASSRRLHVSAAPTCCAQPSTSPSAESSAIRAAVAAATAATVAALVAKRFLRCSAASCSRRAKWPSAAFLAAASCSAFGPVSACSRLACAALAAASAAASACAAVRLQTASSRFAVFSCCSVLAVCLRCSSFCVRGQNLLQRAPRRRQRLGGELGR